MLKDARTRRISVCHVADCGDVLFTLQLVRPPSPKASGQIAVEALVAEQCRLLVNAQTH